MEQLTAETRSATRVPPHNLSAEESLLGAMMLSREAIAAAQEALTRGSFYKPAHSLIFDAICALDSAGEPVDPITVAEELDRSDALEAVGGQRALNDLLDRTPATTSAPRYAGIVAEHATLRLLIGAANDVADMAYSKPDDVAAALDEAESKIFGVGEGRLNNTVAVIRDLVDDTLDRLEELYDAGDAITGTPSGFIDLDAKLSGLQPNALVVVGARPAMGKTSFALGMAAHAAMHPSRPSPVLVFSLEMSKLELTQRLICSTARVDATKLKNGSISASEWPKLVAAAGSLAEAPIWIDDNPGLTVMEIRAKARRLQSELGQLGLIVVDYIQLMSGSSSAENRQVEVAEISRGLKILARELEVPVVALAQLNRGLEQRADKRPMMADLRESGSLEQDADVVMFIYRDEIYNPESPDKGMAEVIISKHRAGPTGTVRLAFNGRYTCFDNMALEPA